jgi:putative ABC transport system permease protein
MPRDRETLTATMDTVGEGYFETIGVTIVRGRGFLASDTADAPRVAVVNEQFAKHYWPGADAVGKRIRLEKRGGAAVEIIGVAETIKYRSPQEKPIDFVYLPLAQHAVPRMVLLVRSNGDPLQWVQPVKEVVRALDPNLPMLQTRSYEELYRYNTVDGPGTAIKLIGSMGAVGLLMAIAGLYGLVAYNVGRRTREIGIRRALGAGPRDVLRLVMGKGLVLVGIGTAIGLAMGFGVERLLKAALFNTGGVDIAVYVGVVPCMVVVTMLAAYTCPRSPTA